MRDEDREHSRGLATCGRTMELDPTDNTATIDLEHYMEYPMRDIPKLYHGTNTCRRYEFISDEALKACSHSTRPKPVIDAENRARMPQVKISPVLTN